MKYKQKTLYEKVVSVTEEYLGPAGERFIRRQIKMHLNIEPAKLTSKHLNDLAHWASLTFAVLTSSGKEVDDFTKKLLRLSEKEGNQ